MIPFGFFKYIIILSFSDGVFIHLFQFLTSFRIICSNLFILQFGILKPKERLPLCQRQGSGLLPELSLPLLLPHFPPRQPHFSPRRLLCPSFSEVWALLLQGGGCSPALLQALPAGTARPPELSPAVTSLPTDRFRFWARAVGGPSGDERQPGREKLTEVPGQNNNNVPHSSCSSACCASPLTLHVQCRPVA